MYTQEMMHAVCLRAKIELEKHCLEMFVATFA